MGSEAMEYLIGKRAIHEAVAEYAAWRTQGEKYIIPYFDALGRERTYRIHDPVGKPKYQTLPGDHPHLYCVENVRFGQVVICEGEIDTLSALSAGYKAVGVAGANSFHQSWQHLLDHAEEIIIAFDGDNAGKQAAGNIKSVMPLARIVLAPQGKDLNDLLVEGGPEAIHNLLGEPR